MKSPQRVAAGDCRSSMLQKLQSSCSPSPKPDLSSPSDGPPSPCSRACKDVCRQTSLSGRRQRPRSVNTHAPFASTPKPAKQPNGLQRSRTSPRKSMVGRWSVVIVLGFSSACAIDLRSEPKSRHFFGQDKLETFDVRCTEIPAGIPPSAECRLSRTRGWSLQWTQAQRVLCGPVSRFSNSVRRREDFRPCLRFAWRFRWPWRNP
jgi:hypothetical protein